MVVGYAFHVASLGLGELAVIQVIFVTQLVFILPFARFISKTTITGSDWLGAIVVTVGIGVFVTFAKPEAGTDSASDAKWAVAIELSASRAPCSSPLATGSQVLRERPCSASRAASSTVSLPR